MTKIIKIVFMLLLLNNCASYKHYKNIQLQKEQQKKLIETKKTWLNI